MSSFPLFCPALCAGLLLCLCAGDVQAKAVQGVPRTGFETADEARMNSHPIQTPTIVDAYGNPVTGIEPEKPKKQRLPSGAYGGYGKNDNRPLPDEKDTRPLW